MHSIKKTSRPQLPQLSVIVPMLNEAETLPALLATLHRQQAVDFELILVDGGSADQTLTVATSLSATASFPVRILSAGRGRGRQMNAGAAEALGEWLLFLHADSCFPSKNALKAGLEIMLAESGAAQIAAARYQLEFSQHQGLPRLWEKYHAAKARLNLPGCIHGDQGFFISRQAFFIVGPYEVSPPFLEDDRLSERIFNTGKWLLIPEKVRTSSRRFVAEGWFDREIVNLMMLALFQAGYIDYLSPLRNVYRETPVSGLLRSASILCAIFAKLDAQSACEQSRFWKDLGHCARKNLWQIMLALSLCLRVSYTPSAPRRADSIFADATDVFIGWVLRIVLTSCVRLLRFFRRGL